MLRRTHWLRHIARLDPEVDYEEIYRVMTTHEFPWDMNQSLSFALFRTYAVPSVGGLLDSTGEFGRRTQKRYDDTALLLEEVSVNGLRSPEGLAAIRRVNQMHGAYPISNDDMRYVLSTFVVVPTRWLEDYGWRRLSGAEVRATVRYYAELGRLLGIKDVPEDYESFVRLFEDYEAEHFAFDEGARRVADATLALLLTFYPRVAAKPMEVFARTLMDPPLKEALGYPAQPDWLVAGSQAGLRIRARVESLLPARKHPVRVRDLPRVRSYPDGYVVEEMGTFPRGCPVSGAAPRPR